MVAKEDSSRAATTSPKPVQEKPKLGAGLLLDSLKAKMKQSMEAKIEASKNAWASLD